MLKPVKETFSCILAHTLIFDRLDGHIARMTNTTNQFCVEFDSLAYIISFGIAPAMLLYIFSAEGLAIIILGYTLYGALRALRTLNVRKISIKR